MIPTALLTIYLFGPAGGASEAYFTVFYPTMELCEKAKVAANSRRSIYLFDGLYRVSSAQCRPR